MYFKVITYIMYGTSSSSIRSFPSFHFVTVMIVKLSHGFDSLEFSIIFHISQRRPQHIHRIYLYVRQILLGCDV